MSKPTDSPVPQPLARPNVGVSGAEAEVEAASRHDVPRLWSERFVPLSYAQHRDLGWRRAAIIEPGPTPLLPSELLEAAAYAPIGVRLYGARALPQIYLPAPGTPSAYRPALWGHYPFGLVFAADGTLHVAFDRTALAPLVGPGVDPLFTAEGRLLPHYTSQIEALEARVPALRQAADLAAQWAPAAMSEPFARLWPEGQVNLAHRLIVPQALTGLSRDEAGVRHETGALAFAYAALVSRQHLPVVVDSWRRYLDRGPAPLRAPRRPPSTVESFLTALGHDLNLF